MERVKALESALKVKYIIFEPINQFCFYKLVFNMKKIR